MLIKNFRLLVRLWIISVALTSCAVNSQPIVKMIAADTAVAIPANIQSGDLVFRDGGDITSEIIKTLDHSGYSHVGMIYLSDQGVQVIHATPQERPGTGDAVVIDTLAYFRTHAKNQHIVFYHINASTQQHAGALRYALSRAGQSFGFTANSLYCTQLVYQAWQSAGLNITTNHKWLKVPLIDDPILLPQDITDSRLLQRQ